MQHVAFTVTPSRFEEIQSRLLRNRIDFDGPADILPGLQSIYFYDPNGIRLEACCQPAAGANLPKFCYKQRTLHSLGLVSDLLLVRE